MTDKIIINVIGKTQTGKSNICSFIFYNLINKGLKVFLPQDPFLNSLKVLIPEWELKILENADIEINEINICSLPLNFKQRIKSAWLLIMTGDLTKIKNGTLLK